MSKSAFGSRTPKFINNGVHPKLQKSNGHLVSTSVNIGPGSYNPRDGDRCRFNHFDHRMWQRKYDLERAKTIPHFTVKEKKKWENEQERLLGPGKYEIDHSLDYLTKRINSVKFMKNPPRFKENQKECFPGPSTYGVPHRNVEEAILRKRYANSVGLLERGGSSNRLPSPPTFHLGPGLYEQNASIDEVVNHQTGKRNIFDCNSIDRSQPIKLGHRAVLITHNLGPGSYNYNTEIDRFNDVYHKHMGKFLQEKQYPDKPYQRVYWSEPGNVPVDSMNQISPASYYLKYGVGTAADTSDREARRGFNSSDVRMNKIALNNFMGETNPQTGPGRYNRSQGEIGSSYEGQWKWMFESGLPRTSDAKMDRILRHRVRSLNIPDSKKVKMDHHSTEANIHERFSSAVSPQNMVLA